jgi:hypothetical protein
MRRHSDSVGTAMVLAGIVSLCTGMLSLASANTGNRSDVGTNPNPVILPVGSNPYGLSYGEWGARWWQWAFSFPVDSHPLLDTAGCDAGQSGPVWFLGGSFASATAERNCTVPAGKSLLVPVLNAECSTIEPPPFFGGNEAELRDCVAPFIDTATGLFATIDGVTVQNLDSYRVQSPLYEFSAPDGGLFGGPVSGAQSVSDGVWLILAPLAAGDHTIHFGGTFNFGAPFTLDVTYHITVQPGRSGRGRISSAPGDVQATWGVVKQLYR